jgi:probable DNA metabolism protein
MDKFYISSYLYLVYDGSFDGLLTSIYESRYKNFIPENIIPSSSIRDNLFADYLQIESDEKKSEIITDEIIKKISIEAYGDIFRCYLSDFHDSGKLILDFICLGMEHGRKVHNFITDVRVSRFNEAVDKVSKEACRMQGLVRFKKTEDNIYYSEIEPDHNILYMITPHFRKRFTGENFIIHDIKRKIAAINHRGNCRIQQIEIDRKPDDSVDEKLYISMWKKYFKSIAISERKNPKLQRQFVPARYRKYLPEFM